MASAISRLGAARRSMIGRQKKTNVLSGILGTAGTVGAFMAGQATKAKTAWEEYEAGYKELGGTKPIERPKFGQKGWLKSTFKGPEGEVALGKGRHKKMYDIENVRKVGAFLGSDASAILSDRAREEYKQRTATRRAMERKDYPTSVSQQPVIPEEDISGVDPLGLQRMRVAKNIPDSTTQEQLDSSYEFSEGGGRDYQQEGWYTSQQSGIDVPFEETEVGGYGADPNPRGRGLSQNIRDTLRMFTFGRGDAVDDSGQIITDEQRWGRSTNPAWFGIKSTETRIGEGGTATSSSPKSGEFIQSKFFNPKEHYEDYTRKSAQQTWGDQHKIKKRREGGGLR